jgi:hypothetical protein
VAVSELGLELCTFSDALRLSTEAASA